MTATTSPDHELLLRRAGHPITQALCVIGAAAVVVLVRRRRRPHHHHDDEGRDVAFETWTSLSSNPPPRPSAFAALRRVYGDRAVCRAIVEIAAANADQLTFRLLESVLFTRAQALHGEAA